MNAEQLVEYEVIEETEVLAKKSALVLFVHHKSHMSRSGKRWKAADCLRYGMGVYFSLVKELTKYTKVYDFQGCD
jgi:hypothetical protein